MFKRRSLDVYSATPSSGRVKVDGFELSSLEAGHFAAAEFCRPRLELFRRRLAEGFAAHGLLTSDGKLACYMWLSFADDLGWAPWALGARIVLPAMSGYIFDCKTAPKHRNKGLYTAALKHARWLSHKAHCKKVLIDVEPNNAPAVRAITAAGFEKVGATEVTRFGPVFLTTRGQDSHLGWKRADYVF